MPTSELSRRIGTSTSNLQNIEAGRRTAGAEIVARIITELEPSDVEMDELLHAAAAQSDAMKAGMELGSWMVATYWWHLFGAEAIKSMGLNPDCQNRQFHWQPVVHKKWLIRCHFRYPDELVVLGFDETKDRIEAAYRPFDLRTSTPLPTRATHWWTLGVTLGAKNSDGTPVLSVRSAQQVEHRSSNKSES